MSSISNEQFKKIVKQQNEKSKLKTIVVTITKGFLIGVGITLVLSMIFISTLWMLSL